MFEANSEPDIERVMLNTNEIDQFQLIDNSLLLVSNNDIAEFVIYNEDLVNQFPISYDWPESDSLPLSFRSSIVKNDKIYSAGMEWTGSDTPIPYLFLSKRNIEGDILWKRFVFDDTESGAYIYPNTGKVFVKDTLVGIYADKSNGARVELFNEMGEAVDSLDLERNYSLFVDRNVDELWASSQESLFILDGNFSSVDSVRFKSPIDNFRFYGDRCYVSTDEELYVVDSSATIIDSINFTWIQNKMIFFSDSSIWVGYSFDELVIYEEFDRGLEMINQFIQPTLYKAEEFVVWDSCFVNKGIAGKQTICIVKHKIGDNYHIENDIELLDVKSISSREVYCGYACVPPPDSVYIGFEGAIDFLVQNNSPVDTIFEFFVHDNGVDCPAYSAFCWEGKGTLLKDTILPGEQKWVENFQVNDYRSSRQFTVNLELFAPNLKLEENTENNSLYKDFGAVAVSSFQDKYHVGPNPSEGLVNVSVGDEFWFELRNSSGQNVLIGKLSQGQNRIDLSFLENGIYFLDMFSDQVKYSEKIILVK